MLRAGVADAVDPNKSSLAKTAAAEPILVESADRRNEFITDLVCSVVDLVVGALTAVSVNEVVSEFADTGLLFS